MKVFSNAGMGLLLAMLFAISTFSISAAQGIGTSQVVLSNSSRSVSPGSSLSLPYMVKLVSGTTWGTTLSVTDKSTLSSSGISVSLSQSYGDPTYSGIATISTSSYTPAGNYSIMFAASGDDPSNSPAVFTLIVTPSAPSNSVSTVPVTAPPSTPTFKTIASANSLVNASKGATLSVQSGTIRVVIKPGTYALVNGTKEQYYNFSLIVFSISNVSSPPNYSSLMPGEAYAFAVNGKITPQISFVNATGADAPITSYVIAGPNTTSWTWLGGTYSNGTYVGGAYKFADTWSHPNSTEMVNTQFFKPVLWIFEAPAPAVTTSTPVSTTPSTSKPGTTLPSTTIPPSPSKSSGAAYLYGTVVVIIVLVIIIALALRARSKPKV